MDLHVTNDVATKWYELGLELLGKGDKETLNRIQVNNPKDDEGCCMEMFKWWLTKCHHATWNQLLQALRKPSIGLKRLASTIEELLMPMQEIAEVSQGTSLYSYVCE